VSIDVVPLRPDHFSEERQQNHTFIENILAVLNAEIPVPNLGRIRCFYSTRNQANDDPRAKPVQFAGPLFRSPAFPNDGNPHPNPFMNLPNIVRGEIGRDATLHLIDAAWRRLARFANEWFNHFNPKILPQGNLLKFIQLGDGPQNPFEDAKAERFLLWDTQDQMKETHNFLDDQGALLGQFMTVLLEKINHPSVYNSGFLIFVTFFLGKVVNPYFFDVSLTDSAAGPHLSGGIHVTLHGQVHPHKSLFIRLAPDHPGLEPVGWAEFDYGEGLPNQYRD